MEESRVVEQGREIVSEGVKEGQRGRCNYDGDSDTSLENAGGIYGKGGSVTVNVAVKTRQKEVGATEWSISVGLEEVKKNL
ncbi:hypothetical protein PanWU01x14_176050 [Parasponia andersonii]|uniref:Uncharacterized protein n=1 Tax=Parasponia andersonii TaxID=3476 RepID=A0A2P5C867_PARAD|nr:hypothetical protein PanWU01x14_176050 [Parasponia andersonii]